jgi:hypothetical protein
MEVTPMNLGREALSNMCAMGLLSICTARHSWSDQKRCRHYRKASYAERCMHLVESIDGHCDNVDAQRDGQCN